MRNPHLWVIYNPSELLISIDRWVPCFRQPVFAGCCSVIDWLFACVLSSMLYCQIYLWYIENILSNLRVFSRDLIFVPSFSTNGCYDECISSCNACCPRSDWPCLRGKVIKGQECLKLIFKSSLRPYALPIQVPCESVCNSSSLLEEGPECYALGFQTYEWNVDVAPSLWTAAVLTPPVTAV